MKKVLIIIISFFMFICFNNVNAMEYLVYSDWQEEYPYWLKPIYIQSEDRYLWYREIINNETNEIEREETNEYYKELEGYIKIEESLKTFYRYVTNEFVLYDGKGNLVYDDDDCIKEYCSMRRLPKKPDEIVEEEIENPKTYDNIFLFLIISFISFVSIVLLINERKINLVLSKRMKRI